MFLVAAALTILETIALQGPLHHVQGIDVEGESLWVSSVDRQQKKGYLFKLNRHTGRIVNQVEVQQGEKYHPGGLTLDGDNIWLPVAEYRRNSTAVIQLRDKRTLRLLRQFEVNDHIGCIAASNNRLYGGNWDSRQIYEWTLNGRQLARRNRVSNVSDVSDVSDDVSYQDIKLRHGVLVGSGVRANGTGAVDFLDPRTLTTKRTVEFSKTDRGVLYTHEGMDFDGKRFYMLPEDGPSRLFVFQLP